MAVGDPASRPALRAFAVPSRGRERQIDFDYRHQSGWKTYRHIEPSPLRPAAQMDDTGKPISSNPFPIRRRLPSDKPNSIAK